MALTRLLPRGLKQEVIAAFFETMISQLKLQPLGFPNPVIAAGEISTANDVAISLGDSAVQIGTAYLLCPETKTSQIQRAAIQKRKNPQDCPHKYI